MKIQVNTSVLVKAINDVTKAVSNNASTPILTGVKIETTDSEIKLFGTDTNISIERIIPLSIKEETVATIFKSGSIVLSGKYLSEMISKLPKGEVTIEVGDKLQTKITAGKSSFKLNGFDAEEFPKFPTLTEGTNFQMSVTDIKNIVNQTAFAVATSETRPILKGLNFIQNQEGLTVYATDSHRLSFKKLNVAGEDKNVVVPADSLKELVKILEDPKDVAELLVSDNQVLFRLPGIKFYSRLLDGNYPDVSRLIPVSFSTTLKVDIKEFISALERCTILAKEGKNHVVKMETKENSITLTSDNKEVGVIEEEVVSTIEGEELKISFSAKFAKDALKTFEGKEVHVKFSGAMRPFILQAVDDENLIQLILPVRTY